MEKIFNAAWYLTTYPDVAAAGIDAWQHYTQFGRAEGRLPCAIPALQLENELWQTTLPDKVIERLLQLAQTDDLVESALARWVLARWYGSFVRWQQVCDWLEPVLDNDIALQLIPGQGPWLLYFEALLQLCLGDKAQLLLNNARWEESADKQLARSMLAQGQAKLAILNQMWLKAGLTAVTVTPGCDVLTLDTLASSGTTRAGKGWFQPLVSVIVPCYNAEATLATALRSLLEQSWYKLEILVVDDASTDNTVAVAEAMAADKRIRVIRQQVNAGAYNARNAALAQAKGQFITTHDSDDWSHPQKIALQVNALQTNRQWQACTSSWVRCKPNIYFSRWRMEEGWIYRNTSSLMFRRNVVKKLGYWDCVSVNADTEYYYRIQRAFGQKSIGQVLPVVPLAFGRADASSLSQMSATHLRTQFAGVRRDYHQAATNWHANTNIKQLYLAAAPDSRPFIVPALICRGNAKQRQHNVLGLLKQSAYFDADWYLRCYTDVAAAGMDPLTHFVRYGAAEGRDPAADISCSGLAQALDLRLGEDVLIWLSQQTEKPDFVIELDGKIGQRVGCNTVMLFAHQAGAGLFGAERSLADVLEALATTDINVVVCLPHVLNSLYLQQIQQLCYKVIVTPYYWWRNGREPEPVVMQRCQALFQQYDVSVVYCNTLVLYEPALAAKQMSVPVIMHVRELPEFDTALCQLMHATAEQVRQHALSLSHVVIANSVAVADYLADNGKTRIIANCLAVTNWPVTAMPQTSCYQVALCSSNLPKKGIADFVAAARQCLALDLPLQFNVYGPETAFITTLRQHGVPENMRLCGYQPDIQQAMAENHVLLNLSHFQESFGRTVLEAMLSSRMVMAYKWGAIPELLTNERGVLLPYKDVDAVVAALKRVCEKPDLIDDYAARGRAFAEQYCDRTRFSHALQHVFEELF